MQPAVHVQSLTKNYRSAFSRNEVQALRSVDLRVMTGEIFGLLGPNGAGKTTLIKILLGIVRPSAGKAALFGLTTRQPEARGRVGYLPENHLFPGFLSASQLLDLYGQMARVPEPLRKERIPALLETVRMSKWRDTKIKKFSKGMMQRLGLAQALLNDADLIFLDEPTDGVDPMGRREIRDLLVQLRDNGKTIFLNSHLLSEVEQVCTRVAILNQGRLVREGTIAELTAVDRVYEVISSPIPDSLLATLSSSVHPLNSTMADQEEALSRYRITVHDRGDLNALLDRLRGENILLEAVQPVRQSLEDYFIDVVQSDDRRST
ncbi:MAG: ABC transporter ATP-binding protein [Rhodothermales bacterium]